jgi:hypothetical protein
MRKFIFALFLLPLIVFYFGCSNNSSSSPTSPIGGIGSPDANPGSGNNGGVTIQVQGQDNGDGFYYFYIKPSAAIDLETVTASVAAENYNQTIDINSPFEAGSFQACLQYPSNIIKTGYKFIFQF